MKNLLLAFVLPVFLPLTTTCQAIENLSTLSLPQIMQGNDFVGHLPSGISWSENGRYVYFNWNPDADTLSSLYRTSRSGSFPVKVSAEEQAAKIGRGIYSADHQQKVYAKNGDIFLWDANQGFARQITNTVDRESAPRFSGNESRVLYVKSGNLYAWHRRTGETTQLSDFREGKTPSGPPTLPHRDWLQRDQLEYFRVLKERKVRSETRRDRNQQLNPGRPLKYYYGKKRISNIQASPKLDFITFRLSQSAGEKGTKVPNYVTESGYIQDIPARSKVGSPQDTYQMGVYDVRADSVYLLDTEQIPGIYDKPDFLEDYHEGQEAYDNQYEKPREVLIHGPIYSDDEQAIVVVRSLDNKDRWIMLLDLPTGKLEVLDRQRDEAWVGGPGVSGWNFSMGNIGWMPGQQKIWFQSEETGYSHLYTIDVNTLDKKALTSGNYEILSAQLSRDQERFYITANAEGPHDQHFYHLPAAGGALTKITSRDGNHQVTVSPDEQMLAVRYSFSNQPWELYLMENKAGAEMKKVTKSTTDAFDAYNWRVPEIVWFTASDGTKIPARLYKPASAGGKSPAVIFVHGAGYLQNVHHWWSSYFREYMFHNILADNGYTVLDIDYRASNGYGRDWRTAIYRHMGGKDLSDQIDGAKYLADAHDVDPERIGIYGGSYGGFITLMALFTSPGTFRSGAALRSVTDWAHYNHGYTSNILNTPVEDSIAYYRSSPIYHAENLEDNLLILHGMIDDNVQFQDVVRLAQRLIELEKDNWEFAVFPLERHGFVTPSSWTDEYKRIFKLFQETLK